MDRKSSLMDIRKQLYTQIKSFIEDLDEEQRVAQGSADNWSIKDQMIHVGLWDERRGINLLSIGEGNDPTDWGDFNELNAKDYEIHKDDSWVQVGDLIDRSQQALAAGMTMLDEAQLDRTDVLPGTRERTTWRRIVGSNILHPLLHMTEYLTKQGEAERAKEMMFHFSDLMESLDDSDEWRGLIMYNRACYYALAGYKEEAIDMLGKALPTQPDLIEWSKDDPDLASLREEPAYKALYAE